MSVHERMRLFIGILCLSVTAQDKCQGQVALEKAGSLDFLQCREFRGVVILSATAPRDLPGSKLETIHGELVVEGILPLALRGLKVTHLILSRVEDYEAKSYFNLTAEKVDILNFNKKVKIQFNNITPSEVRVEKSRIFGVTGIISSKLNGLVIKDNPFLELLQLDLLSEVAGEIQISESPNLNISRLLPNLSTAGSLVLENSQDKSISLKIQAIHGSLEFLGNKMDTLSLPLLKQVKDDVIIKGNYNLKLVNLPVIEKFNEMDLKDKVHEIVISPNASWKSPSVFNAENFCQKYYPHFAHLKIKEALACNLACFGELHVKHKDIESFKTCKVFHGDVYIDHNSPQKIDSQLFAIYGDLIIHKYSGTINLDVNIYGSLILKGNTDAKFSSLKRVRQATNILVYNVTNPTTLEFHDLDIKKNILIKNTLISSVTGIISINPNSVNITNNSKLTSVPFPLLDTANDIILQNNPALKDINKDFPLLTQVKGSLIIDNTNSSTLNIPIDTIQKNLTISNNPSLTSANLPYLESVGGTVKLNHNPRLKLLTLAHSSIANQDEDRKGPRQLNPSASPTRFSDEEPHSNSLYYIFIGIPILFIIPYAIYFFVYR
ncbi:protoplasts-secreted [Entomophthora muscae]|uniref:Protoplasts-secreted n=1 Tax=Entomophthora muscae TaxID=34485 RepID=A0ACC2UFU4_9FUNG|nr:protoplasts-secreted [Entomophthora muscae]